MSTEHANQTDELPDAFSLFKPSWDAFKVNFETFIWQLLLPTALIGLAFLGGVLAFVVDSPLLYALAGLAALAVLCLSVVVTAAIVKTQLDSVRQKTVGFRQSLREIQGFVWRLVGLFVVCSIVIGLGFILFIVPGLFAMQRLLLAPYFLVDQNVGVWESMRRSWRAGKKFSAPVWGVVAIIAVVNLIGWVPFVGWVISLVLTVMYLNAPALRYIQILKKRNDSAPVEA